MGRCVRLPPIPNQLNITLPGGAVLGSVPNQTQTYPNALDPASSLMQVVSPALGAIKPAIDIVAFVMAGLQILFTLLTLLGALLIPIAGPFNPLSALFPVPNVKDENGEDIVPNIPDVSAPLLELGEQILQLVCKGLKLTALVPQLSAIATIKDALITVLTLMDAVQSEINSAIDQSNLIFPEPTGIPIVDQAVECARERAEDAINGKMGVLATLAPILELISILASIIAQPLPRVIFTMANIMVELGVISFPDDDAKQTFLDIIDEMTTTGLSIDIPDFGDLSDIGSKIQDIKDKLGPLLPVIETIQLVVNKLTNC